MRDDEPEEDLDELLSDDPASELERLDAILEELAVPDEPSAPLSRKELQDLVEQVIAEELSRLGGKKAEE